jgi:hypothetical protein
VSIHAAFGSIARGRRKLERAGSENHAMPDRIDPYRKTVVSLTGDIGG